MLAGAVAALAALRVASRGRNIVARSCLATCAAAVVWLLSDLLFLKGAERLWGILSAWFAGGGARPPPQCAQGAIWKTHGSSG